MKNISKHPLILGSLILTMSGILSKTIGFLYKIFLTRTIGAEGLGLYQLITPIFVLSVTVTCLGFQTAISKYVASKKDESTSIARRYLLVGIILSTTISLSLSIALYYFAPAIACKFICEKRCIPLIRIMSLSLVPGSIHSCINGYYFGMQKTTVPALSMLFEQFARVGSVFLFYKILTNQGHTLTVKYTVIGIVISELVALLFSLSFFLLEKKNTYGNVTKKINSKYLQTFKYISNDLLKMIVPLSLNYILLNLCSSYENIIIPQKLQEYGFSSKDALSIFGILTGITLPIIFFPGVITNSIASLLLPQVSNSVTKSKNTPTKILTNEVIEKIKKVSLFGLLFGITFNIVFFIFGDFLGNTIFHSDLAAEFIRRLCWICPFLYLTGLLGSVIHGLGKPKIILFVNTLASIIRISLIIMLVPKYGISAYLWGLLFSQIFECFAFVYFLRKCFN